MWIDNKRVINSFADCALVGDLETKHIIINYTVTEGQP